MTSTQPASSLRADARRNADRVRHAAAEAFRDHGLSVPLEDVAAAAHVSKATIFNRFGGRVGLIDAVIDDVVASELRGIIDDTRSIAGVLEQICHYVGAIRALQYRLPAVNDVLLQEFPESEQLMELCHVAEGIHEDLVAEGHAAGVLVPEFTPGDFHALTLVNALALKHGSRPSWADYDRRTGFLLGGICRPARPLA